VQETSGSPMVSGNVSLLHFKNVEHDLLPQVRNMVIEYNNFKKFFGFLTLEDGTDMLSRTIVTVLHYSLSNSPQQRRSN